MVKTLIALATTGLLACGTAAAGTTTIRIDTTHPLTTSLAPVQYDRSDERVGNINEREGRLSARIQRGQETGRITDREARRLHRELRDIEAKEHAFRSDGHLSGRESAELNRDLDRLTDHVRQEARDEQRY